MDLGELNLSILYARANDGFLATTSKNPSLSVEELGIPWNSIKTTENEVCVRFTGTNFETPVIETKLGLINASGASIGYYCLQEDVDGAFIDDFLVFS